MFELSYTLNYFLKSGFSVDSKMPPKTEGFDMCDTSTCQRRKPEFGNKATRGILGKLLPTYGQRETSRFASPKESSKCRLPINLLKENELSGLKYLTLLKKWRFEELRYGTSPSQK